MADDETTKKKTAPGCLELPTGLKADLVAIGQEALRIHESALYSGQSQFEQAKIWRGINLWLGAPAAALAALGGSAVLASDSWKIGEVPASAIGGSLALAAAALTAILTTVNASRRQTQSQSSGNAFLQLQTAARQFATIDISRLNYDDARDELKSLTNSRDELNKTADVPSRRAYKKAQKNIGIDGGQTYVIDDTE